jgi:hypothetical protein
MKVNVRDDVGGDDEAKNEARNANGKEQRSQIWNI